MATVLLSCVPQQIPRDISLSVRDSHCPYLLSSETAAKGTDLGRSAGKEDPVELDSSLILWRSILGVE